MTSTLYRSTWRGHNLGPVLGPLKFCIDWFRSLILNLKIMKKRLGQFKAENGGSHADFEAVYKTFCASFGVSNQFMNWYLNKGVSKYNFESLKSIYFDEKKDNIDFAKSQLNEKGFYVLNQKIPPAVLKSIREQLLKCPTKASTVDTDFKQRSFSDFCESPMYFIPEAEVVKIPETRQLACEPLLLNLAQQYLGCPPVLTKLNAWWSVPYQGQEVLRYTPDRFHFDMDRFRWIEFFIYVDPVSSENGPHAFIEGTHKPFSIPWKFLKDGYSRLDEQEVRKTFPGRERVFVGEAGTIIAEDTRGIHRGEPVKKGHRLMLQVEYVGHLFGSPYYRHKFRKNEWKDG